MDRIIHEAIRAVAAVSDSEIARFISIGRRKKIARKGYFLEAGAIPRKFAVVAEGLFRYVYIDAEGREFTKGFMPARSFISSYSAMKNGRPSYFYIEALTNSEIFEIDYADWLVLAGGNLEWSQFLIGILEKGYAIKEKRERDLLLLDAETRYRNFLDEYPGMEKTVRQHLIASYLGITPVALSRIKKRSKY